MLYSSVGHGGASGYLAVMALFAIASEVTRPTALILNLLSRPSRLCSFTAPDILNGESFCRLRLVRFRWRLSADDSFADDRLQNNTRYLFVFGGNPAVIKPEIGKRSSRAANLDLPADRRSFGFGFGLGRRRRRNFSDTDFAVDELDGNEKAAGISALFILVNSISGLAGNYAQVLKLPASVYVWIIAAVIGGIIGSTLGSYRFNSLTLRRVLAVGLMIAGVKLIFT